MRPTPTQRGLLLATCASLVGWAVVIGAGLQVEVGEAKLPDFSAVQGLIQERLGEKVLDQAKQQVDGRFGTERAAFTGEYSRLNTGGKDPQQLLAESQVRGEKYADELASQQRAALTTKYLQKGYAEMLEQHTGQLGKITEVQSKVNEVQGKINQFKQLYDQVKFLMGK